MDTILGLDHVGLGVRDMRKMAAFYADVFGMQAVATMPEEDHPAIRGLLRSPAAVHSSSLLAGRPGALTLALFQAVEPPPRPIRADPRYGDIGVAKLTFLVDDLPAFCRANAGALHLRSSARVAALPGWDEYRFVYACDAEGNLIELVLAANGVAGAGPVLCSAGVAVTDLERSLDFYRYVVGLDRLIVPPHEHFSGLLDEVTGVSDTSLRSCLLGSSKGRGMLELVEMTSPRGRSIPLGTQWGDFGYLQLCMYGTQGSRLAAQVKAENLDVLLPLQTIDDPAFPAEFMYLRDPDGIPVEVLVYPPEVTA
jgi:catechol 2,3-dioxygenase-like lactoylglutathione lyase family enzyme